MKTDGRAEAHAQRPPAAARATARAARRLAAAPATPATPRCSTAFSGSRARERPEEARRERVEALDAPVPVRRAAARAKRKRDVASSTSAPAARERRRELVVVPRRVRRRIGDDDAHGSYSRAPCWSAPGTSSTATPSPPAGTAYLREMVELITADRPGVVCLQEVPAWALESGRRRGRACRASTRPHAPRLGPLACRGRSPDGSTPGFVRSASTGRATRSSCPRDVEIASTRRSRSTRTRSARSEAQKLGLDAEADAAVGAGAPRLPARPARAPDRRRLLVANLHATSCPPTARLADAELRRAMNFVDRAAETRARW